MSADPSDVTTPFDLLESGNSGGPLFIGPDAEFFESIGSESSPIFIGPSPSFSTPDVTDIGSLNILSPAGAPVVTPQAQIGGILNQSVTDFGAFLGQHDNADVIGQFAATNQNLVKTRLADIQSIIDGVAKTDPGAANELVQFLGENDIYQDLQAANTAFGTNAEQGRTSPTSQSGIRADTYAYIGLGLGTLIFSYWQAEEARTFQEQMFQSQNAFNERMFHASVAANKELLVLGTDEGIRAQQTLAGPPLQTSGQKRRLSGGQSGRLGGGTG